MEKFFGTCKRKARRTSTIPTPASGGTILWHHGFWRTNCRGCQSPDIDRVENKPPDNGFLTFSKVGPPRRLRDRSRPGDAGGREAQLGLPTGLGQQHHGGPENLPQVFSDFERRKAQDRTLKDGAPCGASQGTPPLFLNWPHSPWRGMNRRVLLCINVHKIYEAISI